MHNVSFQAKRRISSIVGAVVADSASLPLEWIYKDATMKVYVDQEEQPRMSFRK